MSRVLITGAAGRIGAMLRPRLAAPGRILRLLDTAAIPPGPPGVAEEYRHGSITDPETMAAACQDVDAVIHLGGISTEAPWEKVYEVNIGGTYTVFEAARRAGVPRVIFASSNHAVGFHTQDEYPLAEAITALPDTYYGVSKVAGEALGALYAYRYGLDVISIRILTCFPEPFDTRSLSTWLSPDDAGRLFEACLTAPKPGYRVVYGVSDNTRGGFVSLDGARALGYKSGSDAEAYAAEVIAQAGNVPVDDPVFDYLGGSFCSAEFDADRLGHEERG